jgi:oligosaccharyltransferase complex subunit beta
VQGTLAQKKVLVLTGDDSIEQTHSTFLGDLKDSGFSLDIKSHKDSDLKLRDYDHWLYDSLLLLAPKATSKQTPSSSSSSSSSIPAAPAASHCILPTPAGFGGKVSSKEIIEFVDSGRNLLMVAEPGSGDAVRSLAAESGVDLDDKNTAVYDHFHYQAAGGASDHTLVTSTITGPSPIVPNKLPVSSYPLSQQQEQAQAQTWQQLRCKYRPHLEGACVSIHVCMCLLQGPWQARTDGRLQ